MSLWHLAYENRWREHVTVEEAEYVDRIFADDNAAPVERILANLIVRLGREVEDANEAAWETAMGEDL